MSLAYFNSETDFEMYLQMSIEVTTEETQQRWIDGTSQGRESKDYKFLVCFPHFPSLFLMLDFSGQVHPSLGKIRAIGKICQRKRRMCRFVQDLWLGKRSSQ